MQPSMGRHAKQGRQHTDLPAGGCARLQECYQHLCMEAPRLKSLKAAVALLQQEVKDRRAVVAQKEAQLAAHNPPIFQAVQVAGCILSARLRKAGQKLAHPS